MPLQASIGLIKSNTSLNQSYKSSKELPNKSLPYDLNIYTITSSVNAKTFLKGFSYLCRVLLSGSKIDFGYTGKVKSDTNCNNMLRFD